MFVPVDQVIHIPGDWRLLRRAWKTSAQGVEQICLGVTYTTHALQMMMCQEYWTTRFKMLSMSRGPQAPNPSPSPVLIITSRRATSLMTQASCMAFTSKTAQAIKKKEKRRDRPKRSPALRGSSCEESAHTRLLRPGLIWQGCVM